MELLLNHKPYIKYNCNICGNLKVVPLLLGMQLSIPSTFAIYLNGTARVMAAGNRLSCKSDWSALQPPDKFYSAVETPPPAIATRHRSLALPFHRGAWGHCKRPGRLPTQVMEEHPWQMQLEAEKSLLFPASQQSFLGCYNQGSSWSNTSYRPLMPP